MNIEEKNGTVIFKRSTDYEPGKSWRNYLIGRPLQTADAPLQTIGKFLGLAVFSSDALSSVAYGPQEIFLVLAVAGVASFHLALPIAIAICILLAILTISYEQTIHAYPGGGGAYIVARDNLGEFPALVAGAALLIDYVLTVAVSISSGVAQLVSAYPALFNSRILIAVVMVAIIMVINLRGVKESGVLFAIPSYFFLVMMYITVIAGFIGLAGGSLGTVTNPPMDVMLKNTVLQPLTIFLVLRAFSSGTASVTGVEAISNGITAFKHPASKNAGQTLLIMAAILTSLLVSITYLAIRIGGLPSEEETLISQLARTAFHSRGIIYLLVISSTTIILMMAANTAFAGFPRLSALIAEDGYLPRQLAYKGSRLVYSHGIAALAVLASLLVIAFQASVSRLIPLYAIGVFLSFTLAQAGMAIRWKKCGTLKAGQEVVERGSTLIYDAYWTLKMLINGFGSVTTLFVMGIFTITKFMQGAWIVILLLPIIVVMLYLIQRHYGIVAKQLSLEHYTPRGRITHQRIIMPISGVHQVTLAALRYAKTLSDDITVVHVSIDEVEAQRVIDKWEQWGDGYRLVILESPYRLFIEPLLEYIDEIDAQRQQNEVINIVVPQFVPHSIFGSVLHTRTADTLRRVLLNRKDIVILEVPYQVD